VFFQTVQAVFHPWAIPDDRQMNTLLLEVTFYVFYVSKFAYEPGKDSTEKWLFSYVGFFSKLVDNAKSPLRASQTQNN
jgi:hypothetical protein